MSDFQSIADRLEIEALSGEFTDAVMMNDHDRFASLFTPDGTVRIPLGNIEAVGRQARRPAQPRRPLTRMAGTSGDERSGQQQDRESAAAEGGSR